jgi:hypothetical protein
MTWTAEREGLRAPARRAAWRSLLTIAALVVVPLACNSDGASGPAVTVQPPGTSLPQSSLTFVPLGRNAPALTATTASFWAKVGDNRELRLYYRPRAGRTDSTEYLRFRVKNKSLLRRPDGTTFGPNDSLLITVNILDPVSLVVEFLPAGLQFDPTEPAELKLSFKERGGDLNDDGKSDGSDDAVRSALGVWRQESANLPWVKLVTTLQVGTDEVEARLSGFTRYAIAY